MCIINVVNVHNNTFKIKHLINNNPSFSQFP